MSAGVTPRAFDTGVVSAVDRIVAIDWCASHAAGSRIGFSICRSAELIAVAVEIVAAIRVDGRVYATTHCSITPIEVSVAYVFSAGKTIIAFGGHAGLTKPVNTGFFAITEQPVVAFGVGAARAGGRGGAAVLIDVFFVGVGGTEGVVIVQALLVVDVVDADLDVFIAAVSGTDDVVFADLFAARRVTETEGVAGLTDAAPEGPFTGAALSPNCDLANSIVTALIGAEVVVIAVVDGFAAVGVVVPRATARAETVAGDAVSFWVAAVDVAECRAPRWAAAVVHVTLTGLLSAAVDVQLDLTSRWAAAVVFTARSVATIIVVRAVTAERAASVAVLTERFVAAVDVISDRAVVVAAVVGAEGAARLIAAVEVVARVAAAGAAAVFFIGIAWLVVTVAVTITAAHAAAALAVVVFGADVEARTALGVEDEGAANELAYEKEEGDTEAILRD